MNSGLKNTGKDIVLASASKHRAVLLHNAGLEFTSQSSTIDERAVEQSCSSGDLAPGDIATILAEAKARDVASRFPNAVVVGCDQTLSLADQVFHKPQTMEEARRHLLQFSDHIHQLHSAVVMVVDEATIWRHVGVADMHVRKLSPKFIGNYLAKIGDKALSSVGAYQIEGEGIQLFERIEGDYFTVIGLPLLPLLAKLRQLEIVDG